MTPILLDDGFNGKKLRFDPEPIEQDGTLVKLRCAEPGMEYMAAWNRKAEIAVAVKQQLSTADAAVWNQRYL